MSKTEYKIFTNWIKKLPKYHFKENFEATPTLEPLLPATFDIRERLSPVKNQGSCGSCAIFSVVGLMSDMYSLDRDQVIDLSEQYVINCLYNCLADKNYIVGLNLPCNGNNQYLLALLFSEINPLSTDRSCPDGTVLESCVPIDENFNEVVSQPDKLLALKCPKSCNKNKVISERFYTELCYNLSIPLLLLDLSVDQKIELMKIHLYTVGPIGVAVPLSDDDIFRMPEEDPFIPSGDEPSGGHAMVIIGWKNDTWIIRNSWGVIGPFDGYVYWKFGTGIEDTDLYGLSIVAQD